MTQFVFLMQQLRTTFDSGVTRNIEWRQRQLKQLAALLKDHENELLEALQLDLGKSHAEGWLTELSVVNKEIQHTLNHLPQWMKAKRVRQPFLAMPGKSYLHPEPLGIVLIIGAWNYPIDRKSTRLNSSHVRISYAVFCLKKKKKNHDNSNVSHSAGIDAIDR